MPPAPPARPKHLRLLRPFVLTGLAAGTAGTLLGFVLLENSQWRLAAPAWPQSQLHAQLQLFGFLAPFVVGFATFLVPRLSGGEPMRARRTALGSLVAFAAGAGLVAVEPFTHTPATGAVRALAGVAVLGATISATAALAGPVLRFLATLGGRSRAGYLTFFEVALAALALAGIADALALWRSSGDPLPLLDEALARAAWRLSLEGFTVGTALGVAARMFTGFLGIPSARIYPGPKVRAEQGLLGQSRASSLAFWVWLGCWGLSVGVLAVGEALGSPRLLAVGGVLSAVGLVPLCFRIGLSRTDPKLEIDRSPDPDFAWGARASFAWLALAAVLGGVAGLFTLAGRPLSPAWEDVRRHLIALGFVMTLVATMAGRLAPGYARRRLAWPALRRLAMGSFGAAALLRVGEGVASEWGWARGLKISAASGPVALVAFAALFASLIATLARSRPG